MLEVIIIINQIWKQKEEKEISVQRETRTDPRAGLCMFHLILRI